MRPALYANVLKMLFLGESVQGDMGVSVVFAGVKTNTVFPIKNIKPTGKHGAGSVMESLCDLPDYLGECPPISL